MRIRNLDEDTDLGPILDASLEAVRRERAFDPAAYVKAKTRILNDYMARCGLDACVVAVSGGIDSAVVLGLVEAARRSSGSPIREVVGVLLPVTGTTGVTGQKQATERGIATCKAFSVVPRIVSLAHSFEALTDAVDQAIAVEGGDWAVGQAASYLRTPALYYVTSLLSQQGRRAILVGTTNRDEGGYIGYVGKASDGMVDVQLISDLHKSEVRQVASLLDVPEVVMEAVPTGDMFDGKTDEEVFGFSYDFLELYQSWLGKSPIGRKRMVPDDEARGRFEALARNVEAMHAYNGHKYLSRSPAVHLDVIESAVDGGWDNRPRCQPRAAPPADTIKILPAAADVLERNISRTEAHPIPEAGEHARRIPGLLGETEVDALVHGLPNLSTWIPVGFDGFKSNYVPGQPIGSLRASAHDQRIADILWERLAPHVAPVRVMDRLSPTDHGEHPVWRAVGINPLLRFIAYPKGGRLVPHYDGPFVADPLTRTLMTVVINLTDAVPGDGGSTRFIRDPQGAAPVRCRDLSDWTRWASDDEVALEIPPVLGTGLIWDHRVLHDGAEVLSDRPKILLRTDILFERCDWYRA